MKNILANLVIAVLPAQAFSAAPSVAPANTTASGIEIVMLKEGNGNQPSATDTVRVHYRGTLTDGAEFDSSYKRGQPATFPLTRVIPCWTEGLQSIKVGGTARLHCPSRLAYGLRGIPGIIPPNAPLVFEVELLDIVRQQTK